MGTQVKFYMTNRSDSLDAYILDVTPDAMNTAWNTAVYRGEPVFNLTDKNGTRLAVHMDRVDMFVAVQWNGV